MEDIKHPKTIINNKKVAATYQDDDLVTLGALFLQDQASKQPKCICITKRRPKSCDCLQRFGILSYDYCLSVSKYMILFAKKPKFDQQMTLIEWIGYVGVDGITGRRFRVPRLRSREDVEDVLEDTNPSFKEIETSLICNSALMTILGYGQTFWNKVSMHAREGSVPQHGLLGRLAHNSISEAQQMNLHLFFADIELHAEPTPMRFIREKTGTLTERDKKDIKLLPPYFTKRSLYKRYCYEQGWLVSTNHKGSPNKKKKREDKSWESLQVDRGDICSWSTFNVFWKRYYRTLSVGKPSADICNACHKYCNQLKFNQQNKENKEDDDVSVGGDDSDEESDRMELLLCQPIDQMNDTNLVSVPVAVAENERIILEAQQHVEDAKTMREYVNFKMKEAKESKKSDNWAAGKDCIVADYCQNLALPHLGHSQPGETYYFSPLTVNCFGTADTSTDKPQMRAYVYTEGDGKKGGNNVASLLFKDLHDRGWVDGEQGSREELTVIMDNCGGQNKNKMVLRMLGLLTELRLYRKVNVAFLVAGHTKNICDRLFNLLKLVYRKSNLYGMSGLLKVLNTAEDVTAVGVSPTDFYDWDALEDKIYKSLATGTVNRTHLFQYNIERPSILVTRDTAGLNSYSAEQNLRKTMDEETRKDIIRNYKTHLETLDAPGVSPIKQFELWNKWRDYIPIEFRDLLCEKPTDEAYAMMEKTNDARKEKAKMKRAAKRKRLPSNESHVRQLSTALNVAADDPSTKIMEKEQDDVTPSEQGNLDSGTKTLNQKLPS